ncbi:hypothetical protein [Halobellus rufus]|nr:hypothetical protein [Halobellus rufus]
MFVVIGWAVVAVLCGSIHRVVSEGCSEFVCEFVIFCGATSEVTSTFLG